jgi:hypothetical protein
MRPSTFALQSDRRNGVARCQRRDLGPEVDGAAEDEPIGLYLDEGRDSAVDLAFRAGLQNPEVHTRRTRRSLHMSEDALGRRFLLVHEQDDHLGLRNNFISSSSSLGISSAVIRLTPVSCHPAGRDWRPSQLHPGR